MIANKVRAAIAQRWAAGAYGLTTFYPGKDYEPTAGTKHARIFVLFNPFDGVACGGTGYDRATGIAQVDLMYPTNEGDGTAMAKADEIAADFQRGQSETYSSQAVRFTGASVGGSETIDGWLRVIVTIGWMADYNRSVP